MSTLSVEDIRRANEIIEEMHPLSHLTIKEIVQNPLDFEKNLFNPLKSKKPLKFKRTLTKSLKKLKTLVYNKFDDETIKSEEDDVE